MAASPERLQHAKTCGENIKQYCKKWSQANGDITTPKGKKGCKLALKQARVWGEDMSPTCQQDPEDINNCKHTACAYSQNLTPGDFEGVINTHIDSLQSDPKPLTMRDRASSMASRFSWRRSQGGGHLGIHHTQRNYGHSPKPFNAHVGSIPKRMGKGGKRSRKSKKSRKSRKSKKIHRKKSRRTRRR